MENGYDPAVEGRIFDIERYSTHDGPGIRTTLFLKGCYLSCAWCHNPESISPHPELMFDENRCILDLGCFEACPQDALYFLDAGGKRIPKARIAEFRNAPEKLGGRIYDAEACLLCGSCVDVCFPKALELVGRRITAAEAFAELEQDRPFYERSNGGVTLSGGEPLYQPQFTRSVLTACKESGLHTALDTTAHARWETLAEILPQVDLVLLDLKHQDSEQHRRYTGVDNRLILENARKLGVLIGNRAGSSQNPESQLRYGVWIRMPLIPSINDSEENLVATARFVREEMSGSVRLVELLGYHQLGGAKFKRLGKEPTLPEISPPSKDRRGEVKAIWERELEGTGIRVNAR